MKKLFFLLTFMVASSFCANAQTPGTNDSITLSIFGPYPEELSCEEQINMVNRSNTLSCDLENYLFYHRLCPEAEIIMISKDYAFWFWEQHEGYNLSEEAQIALLDYPAFYAYTADIELCEAAQMAMVRHPEAKKLVEVYTKRYKHKLCPQAAALINN